MLKLSFAAVLLSGLVAAATAGHAAQLDPDETPDGVDASGLNHVYQQTVQGTCVNALSCALQFPAAPKKRIAQLRKVSCIVQTDAAVETVVGRLTDGTANVYASASSSGTFDELALFTLDFDAPLVAKRPTVEVQIETRHVIILGCSAFGTTLKR